VEKALRESSARGKKCIFQPKEGQVFQTIEEAYENPTKKAWLCIKKMNKHNTKRRRVRRTFSWDGRNIVGFWIRRLLVGGG
jgi:hypothetical protein